MEEGVKVNFLENDKFKIEFSSYAGKVYVDKDREGYSSCGPNPLELFLSSLASCVGVFAKRYLRSHKLDFSKLDISAYADFAQDYPMKLTNVKVKVDTDADLSKKENAFLRFIRGCPVHNTIVQTKDIDIDLEN